MFCPTCGKNIPSGLQFCTKCGAKIDFSKSQTVTGERNSQDIVSPPDSEKVLGSENSEDMKKAEGGFAQGLIIVKNSLKLIKEYPLMAVPVFCTWIVFATVILYSKYWRERSGSFTGELLYVFAMIFIIASALCLSNIVLLKMVAGIEYGKKNSLLVVITEVVIVDYIKAIPIVLVWSFLWFIIVVIRTIKRKFRNHGDDEADFSWQDAAETLAGLDSGVNPWLSLGLDLLEKLIRLTVFLSLPAIVWENKEPFSALRKAVGIIKGHPLQFLTAYTLTEAAFALMALPLLPVFVAGKLHIHLPSSVWIVVIIYEGLVWTFGICLEQLSTGLLYLWHLDWEKNGARGNFANYAKPRMYERMYGGGLSGN